MTGTREPVLEDQSRRSMILGTALMGAFSLTLGALIVAAYSSWNRPIWIDEYVHYSWGVFPDRIDAVKQIALPIINGTAEVYYSSSWTYYIADVFLLGAFGASSFALRLPSIIAAVVLLYFAWQTVRLAGLRRTWRVVAILALAGQSFLMYYAGEARPYLPLAAGIMVVVAYYSSIYFNCSSRLITVSAWIVVLLGSISHLYFLPYLFAVALLFTALRLVVEDGQKSLQTMRKQIGAPMLVVSLVLFIAAQSRSVLNNTVTGYDPYVWVEGNFLGLLKTLSDLHLQFLPLPSIVSLGLVLTIFVAAFAVGANSRSRPSLIKYLPGLGLILMAIGMSLAISISSIIGGYEIIPRQWSGSLAIVPVALTILIGTLVDKSGISAKILLRYALTALVILVLTFMALLRFNEQWYSLKSNSQSRANYLSKYGPGPIGAQEQTALASDKDQVPEEWANVNIYTGGPVWQVCGYFGCPEEF